MDNVTLRTIFVVAALVLFILASLNTPSSRVNLGWAGAAFLTAAVWFIGR
jgi:hypothetical protein